ncbi:phytochrome A-associated F-box protein [Arachis duranensis]|uniref:Phytochrome A-associated F-box protein n=1 Tax=Arachis duranensis TaxID=130453 RepID=A0A6P4CI32_ARADU|nr:phytochrome A-associated F-box protein [Arachis duranensis]
MAEALFSYLSDDILVSIFSKLDGSDPRHRAVLSSVCTRFCSLLRQHHRLLLPLPPSHHFPNDSTNTPEILLKLHFCCPGLLHAGVVSESGFGSEDPIGKRRKLCNQKEHLASGVWSLSREQGSKLLARQFRDDCLYICDWPGCLHLEEKRKYRLFRGVFVDFKETRVWKALNDGKNKVKRKVDVGGCAFCKSEESWDLHSAFCLRRVFGFHDDGEPVVRAFVCDNGHVSGAWTDVPMYS